MSGGGGSNPLQDIGNFVSKGVQSIGNFYGFDSSGKWTNSGGVFHALDEGVGEITGRNASRSALNLARDQFNQAQSDANNLLAQQRWQKQQQDLLSSSTAAATNANAAARSGINFSNATPLSMGPGASAGKDFLGL